MGNNYSIFLSCTSSVLYRSYGNRELMLESDAVVHTSTMSTPAQVEEGIITLLSYLALFILCYVK